MSRKNYLSDIFSSLNKRNINGRREKFVEELIIFKLKELNWNRADCDITIVNDSHDKEFSIEIINKIFEKDNKVKMKINFGNY